MNISYSNNKYRVSYGDLNLIENAYDNPNLVQVSIASGCTIQVAPDKTFGIEYKANGEYAEWRLEGKNTSLARVDKHYIYARLNRTDDKALLVFSVNRYRVDGKLLGPDEEMWPSFSSSNPEKPEQAAGVNQAENGSSSQQGSQAGDQSNTQSGNQTDNSSGDQPGGTTEDPILQGAYYYICIGEITATDSVSSPTQKRTATIDGGYLTTPQGSESANSFFRLLEGYLIQPLMHMASHTIEGTLEIISKAKERGKILLNGKEFNDIARDVDVPVGPDTPPTEPEVPLTEEELAQRKAQEDKTLPSLGYLKGNFTEQTLGNKFIRKDKEDQTDFLLKFGEFIDSMIAGKGTGIFPDGRIQTDKLEVRGSAIFKELIYNRWFAQEGNVTYSEAGTIDKVDLLPDGTYDLVLRKRWKTDITAFAENDICYGSINDLNSDAPKYYDSWFRVLNVDQSANKLNVRLYPSGFKPDGKTPYIPGGVNHTPEVGMVITRRGNPVNEERQGFWYVSSYEGCICMLDGVTDPILQEKNYSIIIGKLKHLSVFTNLPINYKHSYVYCRGIAVQDVMRIDYEGVPIRQEKHRGPWSLETAQSETDYYRVNDMTYDVVSHYGCEWMCLTTGTTEEPKYGSADWAMLRGNPAFTVSLESTNGWYFDADRIAQTDAAGLFLPFTTLKVEGMLYNQSVTDKILDTDIEWTRDTGNVAEDNAWDTAHGESGKVLPLTVEDLGTDYLKRTSCKFKARALLRDGSHVEIAEQYVTF